LRVSQNTSTKAAEAAALYAKNKNLSETARELGIHRSTLDRWRKEGLLEPPEDTSDVRTDLSIDYLTTKSLEVINQALDGEKTTPNQIRAAIEVMKATNALRAAARAEEQKQSLAELIAVESGSD
jgi:DNA-binding transcriptional MerR regulator